MYQAFEYPGMFKCQQLNIRTRTEWNFDKIASQVTRCTCRLQFGHETCLSFFSFHSKGSMNVPTKQRVQDKVQNSPVYLNSIYEIYRYTEPHVPMTEPETTDSVVKGSSVKQYGIFCTSTNHPNWGLTISLTLLLVRVSGQW